MPGRSGHREQLWHVSGRLGGKATNEYAGMDDSSGLPGGGRRAKARKVTELKKFAMELADGTF